MDLFAEPIQHVRQLRQDGQLDAAKTEVQSLLAQLAASAGAGAATMQAWEVLLLAGDVYGDAGDEVAAARLYAGAWRRALSRTRQATTLQHLGQRDTAVGELDRAAAEFELAALMRRGFATGAEVAESERALDRVRAELGFDAIVLAGRCGAALGGSDRQPAKLMGWPLADHTLLAAAGARNRLLVGPARRLLVPARVCRDAPAGAGPVAAIAAGLRALSEQVLRTAAEQVLRTAAEPIRDGESLSPVLLLAANLPLIGGALTALREALAPGRAEVAVLVDLNGQRNYLAAAWRPDSLRRVLSDFDSHADLPLGALYDRAEVIGVPDFDELGATCDTPAALHAAEHRLTRHSRERLGATPLAWPRLELFSPS